MTSAAFMQYFCFWQVEDHLNWRILKIGLVYFVFITFLVKDQEEFGVFSRTGTQEEWEHFGEIGNFQKNEHFTETVSFRTVDYVETMSSAGKLEVRAKEHEQATLDARQKAELVRENKEKTLAEKEAKMKKKKVVNLRKRCTGEPQDDDESPRVGQPMPPFTQYINKQ